MPFSLLIYYTTCLTYHKAKLQHEDKDKNVIYNKRLYFFAFISVSVCMHASSFYIRDTFELYKIALAPLNTKSTHNSQANHKNHPLRLCTIVSLYDSFTDSVNVTTSKLRYCSLSSKKTKKHLRTLPTFSRWSQMTYYWLIDGIISKKKIY